MQIVNQTIPRALRKLGYPEETGRGDRRVHRRARPRHRRAGPASPSTTRSSTARWVSASIAPMGHVRMMAATPAVPVRRDLQDGQHAGDGDGRGGRGRLPRRAGSWASRRWRSTATTARSASRCPTARPTKDDEPSRDGRGREGASSTAPIRKRLPKKRPVADDLVLGRRRRGLHDRRLLPGRRPRRGLPQARQAGLDPGRRDGRLLDRDLDRPAVRRAAGDLRREVHQHALRAGRHDRRPGHPDGAVDHGLHLPSPGAGLPALRDAAPSWASSPPRSGPPRPGREAAGEAGTRAGPGRPRVERADRDQAGAEAARAPSAAAGARRSARRRSCWSGCTGKDVDAPLCFTCGTKMRPAGSCYVCEGCGSTSGCS